MLSRQRQQFARYWAVVFIREKEFLGQVIEIAGDELFFTEAMKLLSKSLTTTIRYEQLPDVEAEQFHPNNLRLMSKLRL
jgi:hypothetical protein